MYAFLLVFIMVAAARIVSAIIVYGQLLQMTTLSDVERYRNTCCWVEKAATCLWLAGLIWAIFLIAKNAQQIA